MRHVNLMCAERERHLHMMIAYLMFKLSQFNTATISMFLESCAVKNTFGIEARIHRRMSVVCLTQHDGCCCF